MFLVPHGVLLPPLLGLYLQVSDFTPAKCTGIPKTSSGYAALIGYDRPGGQPQTRRKEENCCCDKRPER
jgi:hypothetical protein